MSGPPRLNQPDPRLPAGEGREFRPCHRLPPLAAPRRCHRGPVRRPALRRRAGRPRQADRGAALAHAPAARPARVAPR
jgi:hypothetical protein